MLRFHSHRRTSFLLGTQLLFLIAILACAPPATAAPLNRPFSGIGILLIRPLPAARNPETPGLVLYREPGVARMTTIAPDDLPSLAPALKPSGGERIAIVTDKRGMWLRIVYDDAGRTGWILSERSWDYVSWREYLPEKTVRLLPGLRKNFYSLSVKPAENAPSLAVIQQGKPLRVADVVEEWCELESPGTGWLRWRDGDGRLLIAVDAGDAPQNH